MLAAQTTQTGRHVHRVFEDGFGRRYKSASRDGADASLEILCFRHEITDVPSFEFALRERVARLAQFQHPDYAQVRKVDRLNDERGTVALMSDAVKGVRLSDILADAQRGGPSPDLSAILSIVQQLAGAVGALHDQARVAHGAIAPERVVLRPLGRICIAEHAMGAALEQLKYSRDRYWKELRVALPEAAGLPRLDERTDVTQIGAVMLALVLGRPLRDADYPAQLERLVVSTCANVADDTPGPLPSSISEWLRRALQLDVRRSFRSITEAQSALDQLLHADITMRADIRSVERLLQHHQDWTQPSAIPEKPAFVSEGITRFEPVEATVEESKPADAEEEEEPMRPAHSHTRDGRRVKWMVAGLALTVLATGGVFAARKLASGAPEVVTGIVTIDTTPPGAEVQVDGVKRGRTPLRLTLASGAHTFTVHGADGEPRRIPVTVQPGAQVSHHLELPKPAALLGQLSVRTEPAGARISIDGTPLGKTPMTILELAPGEHTVTLESDIGTLTHKVMIDPGVPASLMVPMAAAATVSSGWISVTAPVVMDLHENGRLLGTSGIDRIMLSAGKHEIEIVSEPLAYRETRTVQVVPGKVVPIAVTLPKGVVSINAVPWATVSIDGEHVGDTPIGNLPLTIGPHEVVFRNTALGEQRRVITVTTGSPVRLSVDMAKK